MFIRTPYNYDTEKASLETGLSTPEKSRTKQAFKDECDINVIMERFGQTRELPASSSMPISGDFTNVGDFHTSMNQIREAQERFMELPADLRKKFDNDAGKFVDFCLDDSNRDKAVEYGLVAKAPPAPDPAPPASSGGGNPPPSA